MVDPRQRKELTSLQKNEVANWLLHNSTNKVLHYGAKKTAAEKFGISLRTVLRIWNSTSALIASGKPVNLVSKKKGVQHKDKWKLDEEKMKSLSVLERSSIRKCAVSLGVSKWLMQTWIKAKKVRPHSNAIKPFLTPLNMLNRLHFSLLQLRNTSRDGKIPFQTMYNTIHMDEKWFNLTKTNGRYYLVVGETEPHRTCKSKNHIEKIMFECIVSRPIIDSTGKVLFSGKFAIIPFTYEEAAQRNSKNRVAGTMVTKPIQAITKSVMKDTMLQKMLPIIKSTWPPWLSKDIFIQQDNARPHISNDDPDFRAAASANGFNIQLVCQPANSPDTNVNDLGFFRALETLKDEKMASSVDQLLTNVLDAFENFEPWKLNNVFLTYQGCLHEIIKCKGSNKYKVPHMGKERLMRLGMLPEYLEVDAQLVQESWDYLKLHGIEQAVTHINRDITQGLQQLHLED